MHGTKTQGRDTAGVVREALATRGEVDGDYRIEMTI